MAGKRIVTLMREVAAGLRGKGLHGLASDFENSARGCEGGSRQFNNDQQAVDLILMFVGDAALAKQQTERASALELALLKVAAHHQGGHSDSGHVICETLGLAHPITMDDLFDYAERKGLKPLTVWPWATQTADLRAK